MSYEYNLGLRFKRVVREHADRPALCFDADTHLTYGELDAQSTRIAENLASRGIGRRAVVALSGEKTPRTYGALLACLKLGAVYTMLDPEGPSDRLRKIVETCRPSLLVGAREFLTRHAETLRHSGVKTACITDIVSPGQAGQSRIDSDMPIVTGDDPAYIMFTSGSTGAPKGAVMTHANVLNLADWAQETYGIEPDDVQTNVNPLYFDNSVFDIYASLLNGSCLVPFSKEETRNVGALVGKVEQCGCTLWFSVPSLLIYLQTMHALDGTRLRCVRRFIFGGEGYPKGKLKAFFEAYRETSELHNVYGPTECTCICSSYRVTERDFDDMQGLAPLGAIAPNFDYRILDDNLAPVPVGAIGELCLLGPNVGKGYYNDPERTAAAFVVNLRNPAYGERMYRTGDLVSQSFPDGLIRIHGRKDNQIKHMGYRIELEEVEAALHRLDYVTEAVMLHSVAAGISRLIAVVMLKTLVTEDRVRADLRELLPDYMIPGEIIFLPELPKNANGKVDRRGLEGCYGMREMNNSREAVDRLNKENP